MKDLKTCIIIAGPTAIGKTSLSVSLATKLGTEIISADSRQCYRELDIGVAKPSEEELANIPHHFISTLSVEKNFSAAGYEKYALSKLEELFLKHDTVIMTGGTGLYLKAFAEGMDEIPEIEEAIRKNVRDMAERAGFDWVKKQLEILDPVFCESENITNPQRSMRALEVIKSTGNPISYYQKKTKAERPFRLLKILLQEPVELLYKKIEKRVDAMIGAGLVEEARTLFPYKDLNALNTVGYKELFEYFEGKISLDEAIVLIKRNTRRYAKRQNTWFRKDEEFIICHPDLSSILQIVTAHGISI